METQNHLMHPRVAHNHRDNGYFPTDQATLSRIAACLDIPASAGGLLRIFDPCCGTGEALASLASTLQSEKISCQTYGIELEKDRAQEAMSRLTSVIKSDVENCTMQGSAVGLLFLNPPYGFAAKDNLSNQRTKRLEELFFARTFGTLQPGGVLVMIVPEAALTEHLTGEIATHCTDVRMIRAAADTYKQLVIFGIRPKNKASISKKQADAQQRLLKMPLRLCRPVCLHTVCLLHPIRSFAPEALNWSRIYWNVNWDSSNPARYGHHFRNISAPVPL